MGDPVRQELIEGAKWRENPQYPGLHELWGSDDDDEWASDDILLAWVQKRPQYCDRGHWQGQIEYSPGNPLDPADGGLHYYMRFEVAKEELRSKLLWRLCKIRANGE